MAKKPTSDSPAVTDIKVQDLEHISVRQLAFKIKEADSPIYAGKTQKGEEAAKARRPSLAFFLGAGASKESGIMLASEMINIFKKEIFRRDCHELETEDEREKWLNKQKWHKKEKPYGCLFEQYRPDKLSRQRFIEEMISKAEPSFGYLILADLLNRNYINTIITTNFDDLVYVSATTFTGNRPVVYAYGIMASEMKIVSKHSRVLKLHGDYLYSSIVNTADEMQEQSEAMSEPKKASTEFIKSLNMARQVQNVFNEYGLVMIGYGGEDETVLELLGDLSPDNGLYWCYRKDAPPNQDVLQLVKNKRGKLVDIDGFDRLMKEIGDVTDFSVEGLLASFDQRKEKTKRLITQFDEKYTKKALGEYAVELKEQAAETKPKDELSANDYFILGYDADERKDFQKAEEAYRKAIELDPAYSMVHNNLGRLFYHDKRIKEAEESYRKAIELDLANFLAHNNLGVLLYDNQNLKEAEEAYRKAIEIDPAYSLAHNNLGVLLKKDGRPKEAEEEYRKAVDLDPANSMAHNNLGHLLYNDKRIKEAEEAYRKAIEIDPAYSLAHNNLGALLKNNGRPKEAEEEYRKAIEIDPTYATAHYNLGLLLRNDGRLQEAEEEFRRAIELDPNDLSAYEKLGDLLRMQERFDEAIELSLEALNKNLSGKILFINLAALYKEKDDRDKSAQYLKEAEKLLEPDAGYNKACFYAIAENKDEAFKYLKIALDEDRIKKEFVRNDPDWKWIKDDPRFEELTAGE